MTQPPDSALAGLAAALAGEFTIESELGRGGMGVVYLARDVQLDRQVALKVLPPSLGADPDTRLRFLREARTAAQLSHPHIVPIHRADERGGFAFFAMGLVDGETLGARVKDRGPLPPGDVVRHLREVAWALAYAHARGVIHRDVKPENIMIERGTNRAMVTDFGIARSDRVSGLTADGQVLGTAHYMSPEQIEGSALDGRSDLYALGVVGFYLLSGRLPFDAESATAVLVAHVTRPAPTLRSVAPQVPMALAAVIDRCLAKEPSARFESGEALSDALGKALEEFGATPADSSGGHRQVSEDQAAAIWRRAAQLQAEAASRLERDTRSHATLGLAGERQLGAGSTASTPEVDPISSYRLRDVEVAAVEAGISQRFVALAISEMPNENLAVASEGGDGARETVGTALLGEMNHSLSVSRVIRAPAREVLKALGRTFQGQQFRMTLVDQLGPHPLDGGIMVFKLPPIDWSGQTPYPFNWLAYGAFGKTVRATLRVLEHDRSACEVSLYVDLRPGIRANVWTYSSLTVGASATSAAVGGIVGAQALALAGAMIALPAAVTLLAGGSLAVLASRASYKYCMRKATAELEDLLAATDATFRTRNIFELE